MREIKFRAWDKEVQEMIYDSFEYHTRSLHYCARSPTKSNIQLGRCVTPCKKDNHFIGCLSDCPAWAMMQYTSLHDKNGKEIYDGDIVKFLIEGIEQVSEVVEWRNTGFELFFQETDHYFRVDLNSVEILGNIYENPELKEANAKNS